MWKKSSYLIFRTVIPLSHCSVCLDQSKSDLAFSHNRENCVWNPQRYRKKAFNIDFTQLCLVKSMYLITYVNFNWVFNYCTTPKWSWFYMCKGCFKFYYSNFRKEGILKSYWTRKFQKLKTSSNIIFNTNLIFNPKQFNPLKEMPFLQVANNHNSLDLTTAGCIKYCFWSGFPARQSNKSVCALHSQADTSRISDFPADLKEAIHVGKLLKYSHLYLPLGVKISLCALIVELVCHIMLA